MFPPKNIYTPFPSIIPHLESYLKEKNQRNTEICVHDKSKNFKRI